MTVTITCDGCNKVVSEGAEEFGLYGKVHYCPSCVAIYSGFLERRDNELGLKSHEMEAWLEENRKALREKLKGLPDE